MKAVIIGAGRGMRMMPLTRDQPKCLVDVGGRRILDVTLGALKAAGVDDVVFVGGYKMEQVVAAYPGLRYVSNPNWQENNILESLMCAREELDSDVLVSYSDIVFSDEVAHQLARARGDIELAVEKEWQQRYEGRTLHPMTEAEKVEVFDGFVTRIGKKIDPARSHGEFIGLLRFSASAARKAVARYEEVRERFLQAPFHEAATIRKAYLTDMVQEMIDLGTRVRPAIIQGDWAELDTLQDLERLAPHMPLRRAS